MKASTIFGFRDKVQDSFHEPSLTSDFIFSPVRFLLEPKLEIAPKISHDCCWDGVNQGSTVRWLVGGTRASLGTKLKNEDD